MITGLRRAGKSTLLYKIARDLVESGVEWNRIIYINFEDERLAEFRIETSMTSCQRKANSASNQVSSSLMKYKT